MDPIIVSYASTSENEFTHSVTSDRVDRAPLCDSSYRLTSNLNNNNGLYVSDILGLDLALDGPKE